MIKTQVLATRFLANASDALCASLGIPAGYPSLAFLTADSDDPTYIALDEATKAADVVVAYTHSFYGGAGNASTPYAGEVIGILAGKTPGAVQSGMEAALSALEHIDFQKVGQVPYLAHTVSRCGSYLAQIAGVPEGTPLAYLIAPPLESMYAMDAALKAADVQLCQLFTPPSETNFGGGILSGSRSACEAACNAFKEAVAEVATNPKN